MSDSRDLLRRLAAHHECSLRSVMVPTPEFGLAHGAMPSALDRRTRVLVRLAALIAVGACPESLRWAVELASAAGADDDTLTAVLSMTGAAVGSAQIVAIAPRLALALGFDLPAGTLADDLLTE